MYLVLALLAQLVQFYSFALIIYIFMSWVPNVRESAIGQFLGRICEPYLEPFRKIIPPIGMIDISPIVAIFVLNIAMRGILSLGQFI